MSNLFSAFVLFAAAIALLATTTSEVHAHSVMTCPLSFNPNHQRAGNTRAPCENVPINKRPLTRLRAGQRLKVGWSSLNHGGGYVRLALAKEVPAHKSSDFNNNVLKVTCFGVDGRPGKFRDGECIHPCNGRPGCEYQSSVSDNQRYDTTITVPTNLEDGFYTLQWAAIPGQSAKVYYSCARLQIIGGNTGLTCPASSSLSLPSCTAISGAASVTKLTSRAKPGKFCFYNDRAGSVDARISEVPVNVNCDPRVSCLFSVQQSVCATELTGIANPNRPIRSDCPARPAGEGSAANDGEDYSDIPAEDPPTDEIPTEDTPTEATPTEEDTTYTPTETESAPDAEPTEESTTPFNDVCGASLTPNATCVMGTDKPRCYGADWIECVHDQWLVRSCSANTQCRPHETLGFICDYPNQATSCSFSKSA